MPQISAEKRRKAPHFGDTLPRDGTKEQLAQVLAEARGAGHIPEGHFLTFMGVGFASQLSSWGQSQRLLLCEAERAPRFVSF